MTSAAITLFDDKDIEEAIKKEPKQLVLQIFNKKTSDMTPKDFCLVSVAVRLYQKAA